MHATVAGRGDGSPSFWAAPAIAAASPSRCRPQHRGRTECVLPRGWWHPLATHDAVSSFAAAAKSAAPSGAARRHDDRASILPTEPWRREGVSQSAAAAARHNTRRATPRICGLPSSSSPRNGRLRRQLLRRPSPLLGCRGGAPMDVHDDDGPGVSVHHQQRRGSPPATATRDTTSAVRPCDWWYGSIDTSAQPPTPAPLAALTKPTVSTWSGRRGRRRC
jgi:hypothetical protein